MYSTSNDNLAVGYALGRDSNDNNNGGMWGGDGSWIWGILILFAIFGYGGFGGGWGNGFGNGNGGMTPYMVGNSYTDAAVQRGFDTQSIIGKLDGITNGICDSTFALNNTVVNGFNGVARDMCTGFAAVNAGINENRFANQQCCCTIERAIDNSRFDTQTGFNAIGQQISSCCCDLRSGLKDIQYQNATDTCAIQTTMLNNTRDIIENQNAGVRSILDYLCQEKISDLQNENQALRLAASQERQNNYLVNTLRPTAQPAYLTCNPFTGLYGGYGYGMNGYGYGYNNNSCGCNSGCCGCNG